MERTYALIEAGRVVNVIVADDWPDGIDITALDPRPGIGWRYEGDAFIAPEPGEPTPLPGGANPDGPGPFLTQYAFDMRFTLMERVAIEAAADATDSTTGALTTTARVLRVSLERAKKASYINPQRAETRVGVFQFVQLGLLTEARALEILDAPIQPHEEYRG